MIYLDEDRVSEVQSLMSVATWFGVTEKLVEPVDKAQTPKVKACNEKDAVYLSDKTCIPTKDKHVLDSPRKSADGWTSDNPYYSQVSKAQWLTKNHPSESEIMETWTEAKQVVFLEVKLNDSGITYTPGDSIGITCPNPQYLINIVFERLKSSLALSGHDVDITLDTFVQVKNKKTTTLRELLSYHMDLVMPPKKAAVAILASCCTDESEAQQLLYLCSKLEVGKLLWKEFLEHQGVGIGELLALFPSCTISLAQLMQCVTGMPPRAYSICSSPLKSSGVLSIAFSILRFHCQLSAPSVIDGTVPPLIKRYGICTHYLQKLLSHWLEDGAVKNGNGSRAPTIPEPEHPVFVRIFHKPTLTFHLPGSVSPPLILIGPGTGIAPMLGFLDHREVLENERQKGAGEDISCGLWRGGFELNETDLPSEGNTVDRYIHSVAPGPVHLFFGCRGEDDFLFKRKLERFLGDGTLTTLEVAMSRVSLEKVYVTHKLTERAKDIARLILHEDAYVYICGDGNKMAKDVREAIKQILVDQGGLSVEDSEKMLKELANRRRYVLDLWSA